MVFIFLLYPINKHTFKRTDEANYNYYVQYEHDYQTSVLSGKIPAIIDASLDMSRENLTLMHANNKNAYQTAHSHIRAVCSAHSLSPFGKYKI